MGPLGAIAYWLITLFSILIFNKALRDIVFPGLRIE
jgi:hypothetical protein